MAIELGQKTITVKESSRTWRTQIESPRGQMPWIEVFRERVSEPTEGEATTYPNVVPLRIDADKLHELAPFGEVPPELKAMIKDEATLIRYLKILPALVSIACDAAERKSENDAKIALEAAAKQSEGDSPQL